MKEIDLKELPINVGVTYEGEIVRWKNTAYEFGGPRASRKYEIVTIADPNDIEDGKVIVIGPKISELPQKRSHQFGLLIEIAGAKLGSDLTSLAPVLERCIHEFSNYGQGIMHLNQRSDICVRISEAAMRKGFSFEVWGKMLHSLFSENIGAFEKLQITFITDPEIVEERFAQVVEVYAQRDQRTRGLREEDVDLFYGCVLCQAFSPSQLCVISPERTGPCGALSWIDARLGVEVYPGGPFFSIPKGEVLDESKGEYAGVNKVAKERSLGEVERIRLHSLFSEPHPSDCCCEALVFDAPELDGMGVVSRHDFELITVNKLSFKNMAAENLGRVQTKGLVGIAIEYISSPKFLQADGGLDRVIWVSKTIKDRMRNMIPSTFINKLPTEEDAVTLEEIRVHLRKMEHPIIARWKGENGIDKPIVMKDQLGSTESQEPRTPFANFPSLSLSIHDTSVEGDVGEVQVVLKNVRIYADRVTIKRHNVDPSKRELKT